ncbi:MAG TPA: hypothetical protein VFI91_14320, partial [Longimicrobiaceae bacterium]|nr:hypothetical protein [Longimicrobiaceae bacterium]
MNPTKSSGQAESTISVDELLERRSTLEGWLARIDDCSTEVDEKIADRVRSDYESRLDATLEQLRSYADSLQNDLQEARERLTEAESHAASCAETLQEAGLRYRIGEIGDEEWETRRAPLDQAVREADDARLAARQEVTRLTAVVEDIGNAPAPAEVPASELPWLTPS